MRTIQAPHSTENECAVLGALLATSGRAYDRIGDVLREADFHHEQHQLIYRAIEALAKAGRPADTITVTDWLEGQRSLQKAGGRSYISEIAGNAPPASNIIRYAEIVVERRMARQLMGVAQALEEIAYEGGDVHARMDRAQSLLLELGEARQSSEPASIDQVLADTVQWVQERHESGETVTGLGTGLLDLDEKTAGLQAGDLIVLAGRPAMGKTALAQTIAEHVAVNDGGVLVFSLEMSLRQSGLRALASQGSVDLRELMNPANIKTDETWTRLCEAMERLSGKNFYIDDSASISCAQMLAKARRHKRKHGLSLIVVDYIQLIDQGASSRGRTEVVSEISRALKLMAKALKVPVIALSQLNRSVETRADKRPVMSDLRESGSIEQDADVIMMMYRDDYYNPNSKFQGVAEVIIAKQRMGPTGRIGLLFEKAFSRFKNYLGALPDPDGKPEPGFGGASYGAFSMGGK
ncbi:replicative DNA helicase [Methylibium petroleiphilum]|uniref:Replicative DNA helicase n=1 Tax=Methylibium petroleiphilum (strain ATCC BAA-1232 / LMG 22953 / PM1) TaxID=420662 RepID=A2SNJ3_METPP|nr:replicative DNA helicase [Methylibium petroleiphilum]ABM97132.1 Replicative DNA helicase [Methylibium petroleiphilum PM1]